MVLSDYQQRLRDRFLAAPVVPAPPPWRPVLDNRTPIGGLQGIGFAVHPEDGGTWSWPPPWTATGCSTP